MLIKIIQFMTNATGFENTLTGIAKHMILAESRSAIVIITLIIGFFT